ncbi:MAG: hypothetical protein K5978_01835 [Campylobacter sp.]|nr:hypothetical protein [Campylobacter sp.]
MDYNKENKGIVCFVYKCEQKRSFYLAYFAAFLLLALCLKFSVQNCEIAFIATIVSAFSMLLVSLSPRLFLLRLLGFLLALASGVVAMHNTNELGANLHFYLLAILCFLLFASLLFWFVYNARSSEVNEL